MTTPLFDAARPHPAGFREITIHELLPHAEGHRLVDVREQEEFVGVLGHLQGAELVPLGTVPEACVGVRRGCRGRSRRGRRSGACRGR